MKISKFFRGDLIGQRIKNFPYPERKCPYCSKKCDLVDAIHIQASPEMYKALYICQNPSCGAYDEPAMKAYARVYYSSQEAYQRLELERIFYDVQKKR